MRCAGDALRAGDDGCAAPRAGGRSRPPRAPAPPRPASRKCAGGEGDAVRCRCTVRKRSSRHVSAAEGRVAGEDRATGAIPKDVRRGRGWRALWQGDAETRPARATQSYPDGNALGLRPVRAASSFSRPAPCGRLCGAASMRVHAFHLVNITHFTPLFRVGRLTKHIASRYRCLATFRTSREQKNHIGARTFAAR